jgi:hypothetical protein
LWLGRNGLRDGTPFAVLRGMSKQNNRNPNFYDDGTRNHQGEGIEHEREKQEYGTKQQPQGKAGDANFIPGEAPVGEKSEK